MLGISIPFFNEEAVAESVVTDIVDTLREADIPFRIAVVNNGSLDRTQEILNRLAETIPEILTIHLQDNQGYGGGISAGLTALEDHDCLWIGWMWGDGQIHPSVLPKLVEHLRNSVDAAKVYRSKRHDGRRRWAISKLYASSMSSFGLSTKDINGCPKLFEKKAYDALELKSVDWFIDAEAMLKAKELGLAIQEEPAIMSARRGGRSKVNWKTCLEFVRNIREWKQKR